MAGFDLTTHNSSFLGGRQRRCHQTFPPGLFYKYETKAIGFFTFFAQHASTLNFVFFR
jgi:hypothetical protein